MTYKMTGIGGIYKLQNSKPIMPKCRILQKHKILIHLLFVRILNSKHTIFITLICQKILEIIDLSQ